MFLRGSSTRYRDSSSRAHFLKNFLPLSYGQCLKSARFITIYRWYTLSYFFENKPPFMADAIAINLFTSPLPRQWCKKVSRQIWNSLGLSTIFTTTNLLFSIFEKQNSLYKIKNKTPFIKKYRVIKKRNFFWLDKLFWHILFDVCSAYRIIRGSNYNASTTFHDTTI